MDIELEKIQQGYDRLLGSVERGELDINSALATLANMTAIDSTGSEWVLDPSGNWLRGFPGQTKSPANPDFFVSTAGRKNSFTTRNQEPNSRAVNSFNDSNISEISYDFMENIESYNKSKGQSGIQQPSEVRNSQKPSDEYVESTLSFAKNLVGARLKDKALKIKTPGRKPIVILLCLSLIIFALLSAKKSEPGRVNSNLVKNTASAEPVPSASVTLDSASVEKVFLKELRSGDLSSFSYSRDLKFATLIGLANLDPEFTVSGLSVSEKKVSMTLVFKLDKSVEDVKVLVLFKSGKWGIVL